jgi:ATP-binding cassette, subfamily C (CFTR/MRP), member 1
LPHADHIIVLSKEGRILEQGTFAELNSTGGYVSTFNLKSADWTLTGDNIFPSETASDQSSIDKDLNKEKSVDLISVQGQDESEPAADDASRRTGDTAVYMYYISAVGWVPTAVFIFCMCAFVVCYSYPSKNPSFQFNIGISTDNSSQQSGSKNGQPQTPQLQIRIWAITSEYTL